MQRLQQKQKLKKQHPQSLQKVNWKDFGPGPVLGLDEVGRGCLAGPVTAAAVIFLSDAHTEKFKDSKTLSEKERQELYMLIAKHHQFALGWASTQEIEKINILHASLLAMKRVYLKLEQKYQVHAGVLLIDGKFKIPDVKIKQETLIKGDLRCSLIGAASIVAKVARDEHIKKLHEKYPHYDLASNKGYPSPSHKAAIRSHGPADIHRKTFAGVKEFFPEQSQKF
jgi:ribonuclease HII